MYVRGLGLQQTGSFENHAGFDGAMLAQAGAPFHFEFTYCRTHPIQPNPTPEDLLVFYVPDRSEWSLRCEAMLDAGFSEIEPFNPFWKERGRTFQDPDGYRVVVQMGSWRE